MRAGIGGVMSAAHKELKNVNEQHKFPTKKGITRRRLGLPKEAEYGKR